MADDEVSVSFDRWTRDRFAPEIRHYADILLNKIAPVFEDVDAEQERAAQEMLSRPGLGDDDYAGMMEAAYDHGVSQAIQFMEMRNVFLTIGVAGLFHLFEKQLYVHLNREVRSWLSGGNKFEGWHDVESFVLKLDSRYGTAGDPSELARNFSNPDLKELQLVANAVKHGDGKAYRQLKSMKVAVVDPTRVDNDWTVGEFSALTIALSINAADIVRYRDAVLRFWSTEGTFFAKRARFDGPKKGAAPRRS